MPTAGSFALRRAGPADAAALALLGAATFQESYADTIRRAALIAHCARHHVQPVWAALLADAGIAVWLAETASDAPVGYAVLTAPDLPGAAAADRELRRIYVRSGAQGTGLGRALLAAAMDAARLQGASRLLLGVYARNPGALAFYRRHGFLQIGTRTFVVGDVLCDDLVLARALTD